MRRAMALTVALAAVLTLFAAGMYRRARLRSKESVSRNNAFSLCTAIDEYVYDKQKPPEKLQDLVTAGYLRKLPHPSVMPAELPCAPGLR